jgi:RNA polymerase sigma-70 factor (sigma-E family)
MSDEGFERFVRTHGGSLFRTARLLTGNAAEAEELLQDTLTHLYPKWSSVERSDVPVAYVRRALTNRFVSQRRSPASRHISQWELPDGWDGRDLSETVAVRRTIWQLLGTLPEKQRAAVVLRYFHDLPDAEAAQALGCREATVRSLVSRGIAALRGAYFSTTAAEGSVR